MSRLAEDSPFLLSSHDCSPITVFLFINFFPQCKPSDLSGDVHLTPFLSVGHEQALRNELRLLFGAMAFSLTAVHAFDSHKLSL